MPRRCCRSCRRQVDPQHLTISRVKPTPFFLVALALLACAYSTPEELAIVDASCREKIPESLKVEPVPQDRVGSRLERLPLTNEQRHATLREMFLEAGCQESQLRLQKVRRTDQTNVICSLPGDDDEVVVVGAHFDKVAEGQGAVDNWTGTSLLPCLYESMATKPRFYTYEFVGFAAEEKGLWGSRQYVRSLRRDSERSVRAMVNMDSLGLSVTKVEVNRSDPELICNAFQASRLVGIPLEGMNVDQVGITDSESFRRSRVPTLSVHSVDEEHFPILNSALDRL